jgi:hypothetical protein
MMSSPTFRISLQILVNTTIGTIWIQNSRPVNHSINQSTLQFPQVAPEKVLHSTYSLNNYLMSPKESLKLSVSIITIITIWKLRKYLLIIIRKFIQSKLLKLTPFTLEKHFSWSWKVQQCLTGLITRFCAWHSFPEHDSEFFTSTSWLFTSISCFWRSISWFLTSSYCLLTSISLFFTSISWFFTSSYCSWRFISWFLTSIYHLFTSIYRLFTSRYWFSTPIP